MAVDTWMLENAGNVNHARSYRRALRAEAFGLPGYVINDGSGLQVTPRGAGNNASVDVGSGGCYIASTSSTHGFNYLYNDATVNVAVTSDPTNPRYTIIYAKWNDTEYGDGSNGLLITGLAGTPGPSPSVPATPSRALKLADVLTPAGVSVAVGPVMITDRRLPAGLIQTAAKATSGGYTFSTVGSFAKVNFGAEVYDFSSSFTPGASHSYVAPQSGLYAVKARVSMAVDANATQYSTLAAYVSGVESERTDGSWRFPATAPTTPMSLVLNTEAFLFATQTLDIRLFNAGPTAMNLTSGSLAIRRVA